MKHHCELRFHSHKAFTHASLSLLPLCISFSCASYQKAEYTVNQQLAQGRLQTTCCENRTTTWKSQVWHTKSVAGFLPKVCRVHNTILLTNLLTYRQKKVLPEL